MGKIILIAFSLALYLNSYSQCSDAGVCKIGSHNTNDFKDNTKSYNSLIGLQYGYANSGNPGKIDYNGIELYGSINTGKYFNVSFNIPFLVQNKIAGLGDVILTGTYSSIGNTKSRWDFTGGLKLAASKVGNNFGFSNGYGTNDLLFGIINTGSFYYFGAGTQIPVTKYSNNNIEFTRGTDILLKTGYFRTFNKITVNLDALFIKRLNESEISYNGAPASTIPNSNFTQLNFMGGIIYSLSNNINLDISAGIPVLKRDENSDGTKRAIFFKMGIAYKLSI